MKLRQYWASNKGKTSRKSQQADSAMSKSDFHMDLETFRANGYKAIDWVVDYLQTVENKPVLSQAQPGDVRAQLPDHPPQAPESFDAMLADMDRVVMPGITHWQSPSFFAYFQANSSAPSILGELLSAGLNVQGMLWATSPACTELETHLMDWLVEMLDLPSAFASSSAGGGVIQHSASDATLCALLAAREQMTAGQSNKHGCDGKLVAYTSAQAHSSIEKGCMIAGIGSENLRLIDVDGQYAMRSDALREQIAADKRAGLVPFFVTTCVGTTSSLALDPVREIAGVAKEAGLWLHVDAAYSGTAAICEEYRYINDGVELADSYTFNPHKWMFTNFDCNALFVRDRIALTNALSILPEYLRNQATSAGDVIDYRDWHIPLGRRFRALKLWFVIRHYGVEGLQHHIREHVALAQEFQTWVKHSEQYELAVTTPLNLICFKHVGGDRVTEEIMNRVNASGQMYLTHTKLNNQFVLRMSIGQTYTQRSHVEAAWKQLCETADQVTA